MLRHMKSLYRLGTGDAEYYAPATVVRGWLFYDAIVMTHDGAMLRHMLINARTWQRYDRSRLEQYGLAPLTG
eukprot:CAMPEP_0198351418 /NCGR_PEP_ID=MMETSP1450-20131203/102769_1 /TAXON_ID=753684 ORGANISM="Madagascaria erythrocladiodes, Strain CCMP3234" /NCGR_SAMPLE_ID=MMETSP1450 /ASSEMBLY_ACC=CAM_ASM_001115 /LENGTH=71 /DNA_ID=CAMNT_0044057339 /DNA_START=1 /DNA_END=212 /DNA_ORIENTATION=-